MKLYNPSDIEGKEFIEIKLTYEEIEQIVLNKYKEKAKQIEKELRNRKTENMGDKENV